MKKQKSITLLLSFILLFSFVSPIQAANSIKIRIEGEYINTDVEPFIENNRTLVPLRLVSENLGYHVEWYPLTRTILLVELENGMEKPNGRSFSIQINNPKVSLLSAEQVLRHGSTQVTMDVAPKIRNNRTFVPIRFIAEELGKKVDWDNKNRTVVIGEKYVDSGSIDIQNFPIKSKVDNISKQAEQISGVNPKQMFSNVDAIYYLGAEIETMNDVVKELLDYLAKVGKIDNPADLYSNLVKEREDAAKAYVEKHDFIGKEAMLENNLYNIHHTYKYIQKLSDQYLSIPIYVEDYENYIQ